MKGCEFMAKKPVLLITLPSLGMGGAEQFLVSLANRIADDFEIHFHIFSKDLLLKSKLNGQKVIGHSGPIKGTLALYRVVKVMKPDIILTSIYDLNLVVVSLGFFLRSSTKVIIREALDPGSSIRYARYPKLAKALYVWLYPKADRIICLSSGMRDEMLNILYPFEPWVDVISNGVSEQRMAPLPIKEHKGKIILAVGRLVHQKGFDQLIKAFSCFVGTPAGKGYRLVLVGDGPLKQELHHTISVLGLASVIHLAGLVDDPIPYYEKASFLVLPSRFEGVSNVMLEALVNGVPVLATKARTSAEYYIDKSNGVLIDCCNDAEILSGFEEIDKRLDIFDRNMIAIKWRSIVGMDVIAKCYTEVFWDVQAFNK